MPRPLLTVLACLAAAAPALPAAAQPWTGVAVARPAPGLDPGRGDGRRGRQTVVIGDYGYRDGNWAYANNRDFEPDSYNGWWHERTERSYPRWLQNNQNCERRWWGGGSWRC